MAKPKKDCKEMDVFVILDKYESIYVAACDILDEGRDKIDQYIKRELRGIPNENPISREDLYRALKEIDEYICAIHKIMEIGGFAETTGDEMTS